MTLSLLKATAVAFTLLADRKNMSKTVSDSTLALQVDMMKAMEYTKKDGFQVTEIRKPTPDKGQVLVKVQTSSIGKSMYAVTNGEFTGRFLHSTKSPLTVGWNFAGNVQAFGEGVSDVANGTAVWGHLQYDPNQKQGSFAEYVAVPQEDLAMKPDNVPYQVAAGAATETLTALQAMRDQGGLQKGDKVMIIGAAGGVGSAAVGIAKRLGAHVTGVCSTKDVERVKSLGADVVIDRKKQDPFSAEKAYNVVFDTPCAYSYGECAKALTENGVYVATLPSLSILVGKVRTLFNSKKCTMVAVKSKREDLELVSGWLSDGLKVPIESTYKVSDLNDAYSHRNDRSSSGLVVIDVAGGWK